MKPQYKSSTQSNRIILLILPSLLIICIGFFYIRFVRPNWLNRPSEWTSKWLKSPTCQLPCFENIVPGKTHQKDIKMILEGNPRVLYTEVSEVIPYGPVLTLDISNDKRCCDTHVYFDDKNIVQVVQLFLEEGAVNPLNLESLLGTGLYLDDIVSIYGYPERVIFLYWDYGYTTFDLVYPEFGMVVELAGFSMNRENPKVKVGSYSPIGKIYLGTTELKSLFEYFTRSFATVSETYDWKG
jgi:hypothetical protein